MANLDYWTRRALEHEAFVHRGLNHRHPLIARAYVRAQRYLTQRVMDIYTRYIDETELTEAEMEEILNSRINQRDLQELRRLATQIENRDIRAQAQRYLNALAAKHRITRLESLRATSYLVARQVADVELRVGTNYLIDVIQESHRQAAAEAVIRSTEQILDIQNQGHLPLINKQGQIEITDVNTKQVIHRVNLERDTRIPEFRELNTRRVRQILNINWVADGNFSSRVWNNSEILGERLQELFTVEAFTGMSEREMAKEIAEEFRVGQNVAKRLIRTESNFVHAHTKITTWKEHGVEKYVFIAVLDLKTSKVCQEHDGEIFNVVDAVPGINSPPLHPWCRSTIAAYFGERTLDGNRQARDPFTGESFRILQRDNYRRWEELIQERHSRLDIEVERKKITNRRVDREQWNRYRQRILSDAPQDFEEFQRIKYTDVEKYEELKHLYREAGVRERQEEG